MSSAGPTFIPMFMAMAFFVAVVVLLSTGESGISAIILLLVVMLFLRWVYGKVICHILHGLSKDKVPSVMVGLVFSAFALVWMFIVLLVGGGWMAIFGMPFFLIGILLMHFAVKSEEPSEKTAVARPDVEVPSHSDSPTVPADQSRKVCFAIGLFLVLFTTLLISLAFTVVDELAAECIFLVISAIFWVIGLYMMLCALTGRPFEFTMTVNGKTKVYNTAAAVEQDASEAEEPSTHLATDERK